MLYIFICIGSSIRPQTSQLCLEWHVPCGDPGRCDYKAGAFTLGDLYKEIAYAEAGGRDTWEAEMRARGGNLDQHRRPTGHQLKLVRA